MICGCDSFSRISAGNGSDQCRRCRNNSSIVQCHYRSQKGQIIPDVCLFLCLPTISHVYHRSDLRESLPEMHLWTKKSLLNFGSPPDLDPSVEILKLNFGAIRQILLTTQEVFEGCNVVGGGDSYMQQTK